MCVRGTSFEYYVLMQTHEYTLYIDISQTPAVGQSQPVECRSQNEWDGNYFRFAIHQKGSGQISNIAKSQLPRINR